MMAMSNMQQARYQAFKKAERHTAMVRRLRWMLPVIALALALFYSSLSYVRSLLNSVEFGPLQMDSTSLVLQKPRLAGYDKNQREYEVTAETARQSIVNSKLVELEKIKAEMKLVANGWAKLTSAHGQLNSETEQVRLDGGVHITSSHGYDMTLDDVHIDMKAGKMVSNKPVIASQGENKISADRMKVTGSGDIIRFEGRVRAELNAAKALRRVP